MQQGFGSTSHVASYIAPMFNFRAKKVFQAGIGLGYIVNKGPRFNDAFKKDIDVLLMYNIGVYFPF